MIRRPETDIAAAVVRHYRNAGWDVYEEVVLPSGGRADIVATTGGRVTIVETKTSFGLAVLAQAYDRTAYAHWVYVACPPRLMHRIDGVVLDAAGVGRLSVSDSVCTQTHAAPMHRRANVEATRKCLHESQRSGVAPAGSNSGGYHTPFRETSRLALDYVRRNGRMTPRELVAAVKTHYRGSFSDQAATLVGRIRQGLIPGLRVETVDRRLYVCADNWRPAE